MILKLNFTLISSQEIPRSLTCAYLKHIQEPFQGNRAEEWLC